MKRKIFRQMAALMTFVLLVSEPGNIKAWATEDVIKEQEEIQSDEIMDDIVVEEACSSTSGTCGNNVTWNLDDEGVLTISGTGEMADYESGSEPWDVEQVKKVVIENGVTDIGQYAFSYCSSMTEVTIPDSVTFIYDGAFAYCESLTSVTIPDGVTYIGGSAFSNCCALTSIAIPNGVSYILGYTFDGCSALTSITFPESVEFIEEMAFNECSSLETITVSDNNPCFSSAEGVLYNKNKTELLCWPSNKKGDYNIPSSVTSIGGSAFRCCGDLKVMTIPDSVTSIGERAFYGCSSLTDITIPAGVTGILDGTFYGCSAIKSIVIPDNVISIGFAAFSKCHALKSITIPENITSIGELAFEECRSLTSITIPDGVEKISLSLFCGCVAITSITIPDGVDSIMENAFANCSALESIVIPHSVKNIHTCAFVGCNSLTDVFYSGTKADWEKIDVQSANDPLHKANIHYGYGMPVVSVNGVSLNTAALSLKVGESAQLTATVSPNNATDDSITWSTSDDKVATVVDGKVTAVAPGEAIITVTTVDGGKTATCTVTVTETGLTGIAFDKTEAVLTEGEKLTLALSFTPADATNKNVTWSSTDESVATVADGEVTAIKEGKAVIKAVAEDGGFDAECEITVKEKEANTDPEDPSSEDSEPTPVPESPLGPDKPDLSQYTASGNEIAVKSINLKKSVFSGVKSIKKFDVTSGDTTAVKIKGSTLTVLKGGTVTIAAFDKKSEKLAEKTITVIAPVLETTQSTEINRRGNLDLNKYITSTVKPSGWKSSSKKIAEVSSEGLLTIKKSGTVKITVTFPSEKGMTARKLTIKLKIKMPQFKKTTYTVKVGKTIVTAVKNAVASDITYRIEDQTVAIVDAAGKVTGVGKGTTKLIMTVKGIDYETKIKVK